MGGSLSVWRLQQPAGFSRVASPMMAGVVRRSTRKNLARDLLPFDARARRLCLPVVGAYKGDLVRARSAGPDHAAVEGILNIRYRKAWDKILVDVITANGAVSVDPKSVEVLERRKVLPETLDAADPLSWEDGVRPIRDLDAALAEGLVQRQP